jgi:hypothetical protein
LAAAACCMRATLRASTVRSTSTCGVGSNVTLTREVFHQTTDGGKGGGTAPRGVHRRTPAVFCLTGCIL